MSSLDAAAYAKAQAALTLAQSAESDNLEIKSLGGAASILHNRGAFAATTNYKANDLVSEAGSFYLAKVDFTSGASFSAGDWNAIGGGGTSGGGLAPITTPVTTDATLAVGKLTPVDSSGGTRTMTLPTGAPEGSIIAAWQWATTTNTIVLLGSIRGSAGTFTIRANRHETEILCADTAGSWWPAEDHKTWASIDAEIDTRTTPTTQASANLGASHTETVATGKTTLLPGILNADHTLTAMLGQGATLRLFAKQDPAGGHSLTVTDGTSPTVVAVALDAQAETEVEITRVGADLKINVYGAPVTGPAGPAGLTWPGTGLWDPAVAYVTNDAAVSAGSAYRRRLPGTTATAPASDPTNWQLTASKGDAGNTGALGPSGLFGTGEDGSPHLDGVATVTWAALSAGVYTMTADAHLVNLTIDSGVTLVPAGWRIFLRGNFANAGTIGLTANAGSSTGTGGVKGASATMNGGGAGGAGGTGVGGVATAASVGVGGAGGAGASGAGGAAITGAINAAARYKSVLRAPASALAGTYTYNTTTAPLGGGTGGSGGGGDGTNKGGGAGAGGQTICMFVLGTFANTGTIQAIGGAGGTPATGNCGGGGGGSGGLFLLYSLTAAAALGTVTLTGGAAGSGVGTGAAGSAGSAGVAYNAVLA